MHAPSRELTEAAPERWPDMFANRLAFEAFAFTITDALVASPTEAQTARLYVLGRRRSP